MSDVNICSGLVIEEINIPNPFKEMYLNQRRFQLQYAGLKVENVLATDAALSCIYWSHCVAAECKELLDWFDEANHNGLSAGEVIKEIQMESIDAWHFVMNMGLVCGFTADEVAPLEEAVELRVISPEPDTCYKTIGILKDRCIAMIDCMPWKQWKNYDELFITDIKSLFFDDFAKVYRTAIVLCGHVGLTKQDIVNVYFAKNKENIARQQNGY